MMAALQAVLEECSSSDQDIEAAPAVPEDVTLETEAPDRASGHAFVSNEALLQFAKQHEGLAAALDELAGATKASSRRSLELERVLWAQLDAEQPGDDAACGVMHAQPTSSLAGLPDELLAHIVHLAGKDARPVCRRLRAAYGPPRAVLKEPPRTGEPDCTSHAEAGPTFGGNTTCVKHYTKRSMLEALREGCNVPGPFATVASCVARWPGQFTALELSSVHQFHCGSIAELHSLLPDLQQLKCPWLGPDVGVWEQQQLPQFTGLTSLWLSCSMADVVLESPHVNLHHEVHRMLRMAPQLQSLVADLRFRSLGGFPEALAQARHLTSLTVMFDARVCERLPWELQFATAALQAVAPRLHVLDFWSPCTQLGRALRPVLEGMSQLTRLVWLLPADCYSLHHSVLPCWGRLPQLQQLTLGNNSSGRWSPVDEPCFGPLQAAFRSTACESLQALTLPVLGHFTGEDSVEVPSLVEAVQEGCLNLTSLVLGTRNDDNHLWSLEELPPLPQWLAPVGGMLHLRQLAVMMDVADIGQLACLEPLPALEWLWLQLQNRRHDLVPTAPVLAVEPSPFQALARVTSLRHLTLLHYDNWWGDHLAGRLLAAAARLPQLQVLDAHLPCMPVEPEQYWEELVSSPPTTLRRVLLRVPARDTALRADVGGTKDVQHNVNVLDGNYVALARVKELLKSRLPEGVEVAAFCGHLEEIADRMGVDRLPKPFAPFPGVCC